MFCRLPAHPAAGHSDHRGAAAAHGAARGLEGFLARVRGLAAHQPDREAGQRQRADGVPVHRFFGGLRTDPREKPNQAGAGSDRVRMLRSLFFSVLWLE